MDTWTVYCKDAWGTGGYMTFEDEMKARKKEQELRSYGYSSRLKKPNGDVEELKVDEEYIEEDEPVSD